MAELLFYDEVNQELRGKVRRPVRDSYEKLNDHDPLTYFDMLDYVLIDFGKPVRVSKIVFLPRNDGNGIYPGDEYELFFYDLNGWNSLGRQFAAGFYLDYCDVPGNSLLWLRNLTRGKEERVFTWENNAARFW